MLANTKILNKKLKAAIVSDLNENLKLHKKIKKKTPKVAKQAKKVKPAAGLKKTGSGAPAAQNGAAGSIISRIRVTHGEGQSKAKGATYPRPTAGILSRIRKR